MNVSDIVGKAKPPGSEKPEIMYLEGEIKPDYEDVVFRLYSEPRDLRSYYLIKKADVAGDIYEWTKEEMVEKGIIGAKMYRVPLRYGTELVFVNITMGKLGITMADSSCDQVGCQYCATCTPNTCCTRASAGKPCYCDTCCYA